MLKTIQTEHMAEPVSVSDLPGLTAARERLVKLRLMMVGSAARVRITEEIQAVEAFIKILQTVVH